MARLRYKVNNGRRQHGSQSGWRGGGYLRSLPDGLAISPCDDGSRELSNPSSFFSGTLTKEGRGNAPTQIGLAKQQAKCAMRKLGDIPVVAKLARPDLDIGGNVTRVCPKCKLAGARLSRRPV